MVRQELRREVLDAVNSLPSAQRTVVLLRHFEELTPRRIAKHLGVPLTTVTSRLRTAHATLRKRLDTTHGSRSAWAVPLLASQGATTLLGLGTLSMTIKTKITVAAAAMLLTVLTLWSLGDPTPARPPVPDGHNTPPPSTAHNLDGHQPTIADPTRRVAVVADTPELLPTTGTLIVKAIHADDSAPVPGLVVLARRPGADRRFNSHRTRTDEQGIARIEGLRPGSIHVTNTRNSNASVRANITAGEEVYAELVLTTGVTISGIVVDRFDLPVPGAEVCLAGAGSLEDAELATISDGDGRFELRGCPLMGFVGARAAGHRSSELQFVRMAKGSVRELRLVLPAPGGSVAGTVTGPTGAPVPNAVVTVGARAWSRLDTTPDGALRAVVRTDAEGRFRAVGLSVGEHPVRVRAVRLAPWTGACHVAAGVETPCNVTLGPAMSCTGVVVDAEGAPVAQATVEIGDWEDLEHYRTKSAADGSFRLDGLPPRTLEVTARHRVFGNGRVEIHGGPGETVRCQLRVEAGLVIRGRVRTEANEPISNATVNATLNATTVNELWGRSTSSGADGRFAIPNCPESGQPTLTVYALGFRPVVLDPADPRRGDLEIRMTRALERDAHLVGTVLAANGTAVPEARVVARERGGAGAQVAADDSGKFAIGAIQAGTWRLQIRVPDQPTTWTGWHEVGAGATVDLGEIRLPEAGTVLVRLRGADGRHPYVSACDASLADWTGFTGKGDERHSEPLAPGPHCVSVSGDGVASQLVRVDVRAGERREVVIDLQTGHRQSFEIVAPSRLTEQHIRILRNGELVTGSSIVGRALDQPDRPYRRVLAPGNYTITVHGDGMSGERRFTVSDGDNEVVQVILR